MCWQRERGWGLIAYVFLHLAIVSLSYVTVGLQPLTATSAGTLLLHLRTYAWIA